MRITSTLRVLRPLALALLAGLASAAPAPGKADDSARPGWSDDSVALFARLPVQEGGRIKPLDTFAQFRLLRFNAKRRIETPAGEKIGPTEWLMDCLFFPEVARTYRHFLVRDDRVLDDIGVRVPGRKKTDRYSYEELVPGREKLFSEAARIAPIDPKERNGLDTQIYALAVNVRDFESLTGALAFARTELPTAATPFLRGVFGEETRPGIERFLAGWPSLRADMASHLETLEGSERDVEHAALQELSDALDRAVEASSAFGVPMIYPPTDPAEEEWTDPSGAVAMSFMGAPGPAGLLAGWEALEAAKHDPAAFDAALTGLASDLINVAERRGEYSKVPLEVSFYRGDFFTRALAAFLGAFVLLAISWLAPRQRWLIGGVWALSLMGTALVVAGVTLRCIIRSRPPISTLYETILFVTGSIAIILLVTEFIQRKRIALAMTPVLGAAGMFLAMKYELKEAVTSGDTMPSLVAVLDTNFWLATHVTTITLGYAAGLLAAALGNLWMLGKMVGLRRGDADFYRTISRMTYGVVCFGLLFSIVGTILGGVWANYSWGRFWGWDPKENGALLICLGGLLILHARLGGYIKQHGLAALAALNGLVVAFSWWHVNNLGVGLHSYGKTEGVLLALYTYYGLGLLVVGASYLWRLAQNQVQTRA